MRYLASCVVAKYARFALPYIMRSAFSRGSDHWSDHTCFRVSQQLSTYSLIQAGTCRDDVEDPESFAVDRSVPFVSFPSGVLILLLSG